MASSVSSPEHWTHVPDRDTKGQRGKALAKVTCESWSSRGWARGPICQALQLPGGKEMGPYYARGGFAWLAGLGHAVVTGDLTLPCPFSLPWFVCFFSAGKRRAGPGWKGNFIEQYIVPGTGLGNT